MDSCNKFSKGNQRLLVLGDMKELGKDSARYHKQIGREKTLLESRFVAFVGNYAELVKQSLKEQGFTGIFVSAENYNPNILSKLQKELKKGDFLAIKASRSLKLEQLLFDLTGKQVFDVNPI